MTDVKQPAGGTAGLVAGWWLLWCGHPTKGSPYPTNEAAEAALARLEESRINANQPMYGSYSIKQSFTRPR
ncbi:MAG TPA: hypothetical protein VNM39_10845 [Verrucomicrobiae bacterium]|nr:hypothetical protein [Verrucomicrobiae bacterium]